MEKIGIIVNSQAKNTDSLSLYTKAFKKAKLNYQLYKIKPEQLDKKIPESLKNHSLIFAAGGDGTIRSVAQHCAHTQTILGALPLGTMNHFVKELGLPSTPEEIVQAVIKKNTAKIDCAEVNGMIFINNSAIGFYPHFAKKRDHYTKFYNKWLSYIPSFLDALKRHRLFDITIKNGMFYRSLNTSFLMVSNNPYSYQFPMTIERESFDKALLGIYFCKRGKISLLKILHFFFKRKNHFEIKISDQPVEILINNKESVTISLDGDTMNMSHVLKYKSLPKSLIILTNP